MDGNDTIARAWSLESGAQVRQEADRLGLTYEDWEVVKLVPSSPVARGEEVRVTGTVACHECGQPVQFDHAFRWGMLSGPRISCHLCNVDISLGAYDVESRGVAPLWIYAAPFTQHGKPSNRNKLDISSVDGAATRSGMTAKALEALLPKHSKLEVSAESDRLSEEVRNLANDPAGKIQAIRLLQEQTGMGLKEAKDAVEAYMSRRM